MSRQTLENHQEAWMMFNDYSFNINFSTEAIQHYHACHLGAVERCLALWFVQLADVSCYPHLVEIHSILEDVPAHIMPAMDCEICQSCSCF